MEVAKMRQSKNIFTDKEMELVRLLMQDCQSTGDIQSKLKRLFAGTIEQSSPRFSTILSRSGI
jgi:hypothetical protein